MFASIISAVFGLTANGIKAKADRLLDMVSDYRQIDSSLCIGGTDVSCAERLCKDVPARLASGRSGDASQMLSRAEKHLRDAKRTFFVSKLKSADEDQVVNFGRYGKDACDKFGRRRFGAELEKLAATLDECRERLARTDGDGEHLSHAFSSLSAARGLYYDALYWLQEGRYRIAWCVAQTCHVRVQAFEYNMGARATAA
jgi:hypothetical protein